jgi:hypothetical protein
MGQMQGGAAGVENQKSIFPLSAESTSSQKENERLLTGKPTFRFSLTTSASDPKVTFDCRLIINKCVPNGTALSVTHCKY